MLKTYNLLNQSWIVEICSIIDFKQKNDWYYLKCRANLKNNTELFIEENFESGELYYSYHWQEKSGKLIRRWDNAPHHKEIITFPHHVHSTIVEPLFKPDFKHILKEIEILIEQQNSE